MSNRYLDEEGDVDQNQLQYDRAEFMLGYFNAIGFANTNISLEEFYYENKSIMSPKEIQQVKMILNNDE